MAEDLSRAGSTEACAWEAVATGRPRPPLDETLTGWDITKRRESHLNARRDHDGRTFHLKWFFHGSRRSPARLEWEAARRVAALDIPTVVAVGWGRHRAGSFVVLEGSPGFPADQWDARGLGPRELYGLARGLATHVARLHRAGLCHRDLNVYHVLVHEGEPRLIDVGRVRPFRRRRWIVKDLASLLDSALFQRVPESVCRTFFSRYLAAAGQRARRRTWLDKIVRKARRYRRHNERHGR